MDLVGERTNLKDLLITFVGSAKYLEGEPTIFTGSLSLFIGLAIFY
ncbi:hypothetical protein BXY58_0886 [Epilithonimonas arachidiradicis]|uniref:Uncharacterized protein n=1 Tax=Epilithonimonas arachidiradicis TaxID=1617282 RepID=A0A420DB11_9FLAO|nr:hypothetical protein BXY58_0886 [Epilithonimonas arachidiradicis]